MKPFTIQELQDLVLIKNPKLLRKYYQTDHWQRTQAAKLSRNRQCECCRCRPAVQVHHKRYNFWREDLDRDLLSVCTRCHRGFSRGGKRR